MDKILIGSLVAFVILIILILSSRTRIKVLYKKYLNIQNSSGYNGQQVANIAAQTYNLPDLTYKLVDGVLSDAYIAKQKVLLMSKDVAFEHSVASVSVVAHELGHAIQDRQNNRLFGLVQILRRIIRFTNKFIVPLLTFGLIAYLINFIYPLPPNFVSAYEYALIGSGALFLTNAIVKLTTIPLEFDATKKGIMILRDCKILNKKELRYAKKLLRVAGHTYITSLFDGIVTFSKKFSASFKK